MTSSHLKRFIEARQRHDAELERYALLGTTDESVDASERLTGEALKHLQELAELEYQTHSVWIQELRERRGRRTRA